MISPTLCYKKNTIYLSISENMPHFRIYQPELSGSGGRTWRE
jgi:hypothetical protein